MSLNIALGQQNFLVGDIEANVNQIQQATAQAIQLNADLIIFPELTLTGYPVEDLLLRPDFIAAANNAIYNLATIFPEIAIVIGYPEIVGDKLYNSAAVLHQGAIIANYRKQALPNYGVFDEQRYFTAGNQACVFELHDALIGLSICEDVWQPELVAQTQQAGATILLTLNASPFERGKQQQREAQISNQAKTSQIPIVYVNQIGGQDELVFDGGSFVANKDAEIVFRAPVFQTDLSVVNFIDNQPQVTTCTPIVNPIAGIYSALVLGIKDYVTKNNFNGAILGLSGGIDSALVLVLAVDALGADQVEAVLMPSCYTQDMSNEDAELEAQALGVKTYTIPIASAVTAFENLLAPIFVETNNDATEENIQARCRGLLLMALSNKFGRMVLTTGNKSEMSVGYATLYGDMAGGFAPLKDVPKLLVYALAKYRNTLSVVIPARVISRPPSAELAPEQIDTDSLPAYEQLDPILERYIELDQSKTTIIAAGFAIAEVERAISLVDKNEYKRRQAPTGIKITAKAFGRERRYPITSGYDGLKEI